MITIPSTDCRNCQKVDNSELAEANSGQDNGNSEVNSGISGPESSNPAPDDGNDRKRRPVEKDKTYQRY